MEKILRKLIWLLLAAPAIYLAIAWNSIPETVPLHYTLKGDIDRYGNKSELILGTFILMVVSVLVYLLLPQIYRV